MIVKVVNKGTFLHLITCVREKICINNFSIIIDVCTTWMPSNMYYLKTAHIQQATKAKEQTG